MKFRDRFEELRKRKIKFTLNMRLTVLVVAVVLSSMLIAYGISAAIDFFFNVREKFPLTFLALAFGLIAAVIASWIFSRLFFDPIRKLREGMQKVSDGDYSVRLDSRSNSVEIQEMIAGFNMMAQELSGTEILQTDFVSNVSHEFKTPINAIEGYATLLCGCEGLTPEEQEYGEKILLNTRRLSGLVRNILLLSKIENQSIPPTREVYDLDEQIREAVLAYEAMWEKKELEMDVELDPLEFSGIWRSPSLTVRASTESAMASKGPVMSTLPVPKTVP